MQCNEGGCNERDEMRGAPLSSDSAGATVSGTSKTELDLIWESGCSSSVLVERFSFCMLSTPARAAAGKQALFFKPEGGVRGDKDRNMSPRVVSPAGQWRKSSLQSSPRVTDYSVC